MVFFNKIQINYILFVTLFLVHLSVFTQNKKHIEELQILFNDVLYTDFYGAENLAHAILKESKQLNDADYIFKSYHNLIEIFSLKQDYSKAKKYLEKAFLIEHKANNKLTKIELYNSKAFIENLDLNHNESLLFSDKAIELSNAINNSLKLSESYITKAGLYISRQELKEASRLTNLALEIAERNKNTKVLIKVFLSLAIINYEDYKLSKAYYNKALKYSRLSKNKFRQAEALIEKAFLFFYHSKELNHVKPLIEESIKLSSELGSNVLMHNSYYTLGCYYDLLEDYRQSIENHKKAINEYGDYVSLVQLSNAYIMLSGALWHNGNYKEAYDYQDKYIVLNDSVFNLQKAKEFNTIRTKYEVEKKDAAIALLEKEKEIEYNRRKWLIISSVLLIVALIVLFLFYRHKIKTKNIILIKEKALFKEEKERLEKERELKRIKAYVDGQEKERQRLAKEIHDGVGGQLASVNLVLTQLNSELKNQKIEMVTNNISNSFKALRDLSHSLSKHTFVDKSFEQLLVELKTLHEHTNNLNIEISVYPNDTLSKIGIDTSHNLYRILQELFANIIKHAKASFVQLAFNLHNNILVVIVEDDGKGFDREKVNLGIGLKNIEERVLILNGKFNIDSTPTKGTQVIIEIPLINI